MKQFLMSDLVVAVLVSITLADVNYNAGNLEFSNTLLSANGRRVSVPVSLDYSSNIKRGFDYEYLSDLTWTSTTGDVVKDKSVTSPTGGPNVPLTAAGLTFARGFGCLAAVGGPTWSEVDIDISAQSFLRFVCDVGVDAASPTNFPVIFEVENQSTSRSMREWKPEMTQTPASR